MVKIDAIFQHLSILPLIHWEGQTKLKAYFNFTATTNLIHHEINH